MNEAFVALTVWHPYAGGTAPWVLSSKGSLVAQGVAHSSMAAVRTGMELAGRLECGPFTVMGQPFRGVVSIKSFPMSRKTPVYARYDFTAQEAAA